MKVWSPKSGIIVKLKLENLTNGGISNEIDATTTATNTWQELTFDFSGTDASSKNLQKVIIFFDFGNRGDGSIYYFDDLIQEGNNAVIPCEDPDAVVETEPNIIAFPIDFECEFTNYSFFEFGGAPTTVIDNPDASGINTSAKVAATTKANGAETFAGAILTADSPIDFSIGKVFKIKVWSPKSGIIVKLKLENLTNGGISNEIDATTTATNTWQELTFDFSGTDASSKSLQKVIIFFDFGNRGDGAIYYFDDIIQEGNTAIIPCEDPNDGGGDVTIEPNTIVFPVDFECEFIENYITLDFEGTFTEVINNPDAFGINPSAKVAKTTKGNGAATFAGTIITFENPIDFDISSVFKVKVWSPKAQSTVRLKLENLTNGGIANELDAITTVANSWQELTFDFSGTDANTKSLQKIIIFFDFGNVGDGSVYYWDDFAQEGNTSTTNCQAPPTPTAPTVAAIVPPVCETAIGIFSDANSQLEGTDFFPNWGQNPPVVVTIEDIAGGKVLKYANFSYQGIQLASAIDVSELKFLHIDVWSIDDTLINIYPISPPTEKGFALNLEKGVWNSFDIPLSEFSDAVNLAEVLQFKFDGGTGVETIFIDNLYFYGECYVVPECPQLVWSDEFDGSSLNLNNWTPLTGDGCDINLCGWGNNELQWYQPQNAVVSNGSLKITAKQESVGGRAYTSARLITKDKQDFTYGRFEASIKLPEGQGIWPAFWMFHTDAVYGPWPMSGEIDVMEYLGQETDRIFGTIHHGDLVPNNRNTSGGFRLVNGDFTERFYEFAVEWEENVIRWYIDDYLYLTLRPEDIAPDFWPFNQDFHLLLNMAVGGNLPGNPDATTTFPQTMEVDYVRVYKGRFAHLTGNQRVAYQAPGEVYTVANGAAGSTYNWTVEGGSIVDGQGTNQITVNWGEENQNAKVSVTTTSECGTESVISLDVAVDVQRVVVKEFSLENFDDEALITFLNASGTFTDNTANPAPSTLNNSALVGKYVRNGDAQFDNIQYATAAIPDASVFTSGSKTFYVDFYTDAPVGTPLLLQLENSNESIPTNFPAGRHSRYQAVTTVQNAWQRLAFTFVDRPDGGTSNTGVDRIVFLFNPNTFTSNTFYYDNFDKYCTDEEGKCFDDSDFSLADPCNCGNPNNVRLPNGTFLFEDKLRVDASSFVAPVVTLVSQDGNLLDAAGNAINPAAATFTDLGSGIFELQFYTKPNTTATVTVEVNGIQRTFTTTSCTPCVAPTAVPTMGEWALLIFSLFIINIILVLFYQREQQMVLGN